MGAAGPRASRDPDEGFPTTESDPGRQDLVHGANESLGRWPLSVRCEAAAGARRFPRGEPASVCPEEGPVPGLTVREIPDAQATLACSCWSTGDPKENGDFLSRRWAGLRPGGRPRGSAAGRLGRRWFVAVGDRQLAAAALRMPSAGFRDDASAHEAAAVCTGDLHGTDGSEPHPRPRSTAGRVVLSPYGIPESVRPGSLPSGGFRFPSRARSAGSCWVRNRVPARDPVFLSGLVQ